jgi:hypothetical protein
MRWSLNWDTTRLMYKAHLDISLSYKNRSYLDQAIHIVRLEDMASSTFTGCLEEEHLMKP